MCVYSNSKPAELQQSNYTSSTDLQAEIPPREARGPDESPDSYLPSLTALSLASSSLTDIQADSRQVKRNDTPIQHPCLATWRGSRTKLCEDQVWKVVTGMLYFIILIFEFRREREREQIQKEKVTQKDKNKQWERERHRSMMINKADSHMDRLYDSGRFTAGSKQTKRWSHTMHTPHTRSQSWWGATDCWQKLLTRSTALLCLQLNGTMSTWKQQLLHPLSQSSLSSDWIPTAENTRTVRFPVFVTLCWFCRSYCAAHSFWICCYQLNKRDGIEKRVSISVINARRGWESLRPLQALLLCSQHESPAKPEHRTV